MKQAIIVLLLTTLGCAQTVTVDWGTQLQTIDGFGGAGGWGWAKPLTTSLADFFFTQNGIGLSLVRSGIMPDLSDCQIFCPLEHPPCTCAPVKSGATMASGDLQVLQQAYDRGVTQFMLSSWSPPGSMKSNGSYLTGGEFIGNGTNYASFASILATVPGFLSSKHLPAPLAISQQNEPDISQSYPSCTWTAQQIHDFIPYFSSALGESRVSISIPEQSGWVFDLATTAMDDPNVAGEVGIIAGHGYFGTPGPTGLNNLTNQHIWMTEYGSQSGTYDGSMTDALTDAQMIHNYLTEANINAWIWWYLSDMPFNGNGPDSSDNSALTNYEGAIPLRAYVTGNWSKFVRPGWHRVGVTNDGSLLVTAFAAPGNSATAIVVVNTSSSPVDGQQFSVGTMMGPLVTPWITSSMYSLQPQAPVPVASGSFSYTIPGDSVITFVVSSWAFQNPLR